MTQLLDRPVGLLPEPEYDARLRAILEAAASMTDRRNGKGFAAAQPFADPKLVDTWLRRAAGPRATALRRYLQRTGRPIEIGLRPVRWVPGPQEPWVRALVTFLSAQPEQGTDGGFRHAALALYPGPRGIVLRPAARAGLDDTLVARLAEACQTAGVAAGRAGWLELFESAPGLAYVIGIVCAQWVDAVAEIFVRLERDFSLLRDTLWNGADPGDIVAFRGDAGDRHAQGRSVALIDFEHGQSVVYKPKELDHVAAYQQLVAFLNDAGLPLTLRTRRLVRRQGYGWEEFVTAEPCENTDGFALFYRRLGMTLRLMQLLSGRDMWADNLIAAGDQPVLIDLECLLVPTARPLPIAMSDPEAVDALGETVAATSMVHQPWSAPLDTPILDVGCLSRAGSVQRPDGKPLLALPSYRPYTAAETADPDEYADEVVLGYRQMHDVLVRTQGKLANPQGPLAAFHGAWVRHIRRNTWDCYRLIRIGVGPAALSGGIARELELAGLMRSVFTMLDDPANRPDLVETVWSEMTALRRLDIPLFGSRTDSSSAFDADGDEIADHFAGTAWASLQRRVAALHIVDLDAQLDVLASCLDAARDGLAHSAVAGPATANASTDELITGAVAIGDLLLKTRFASGDWIGQTWHPVTGLRNIEVLGSDLGSGTTGIAVVFAELFALTGEDRFRTACLETLDAAVRLTRAVPSGPRHQRVAGASFVPGGFAGTGSVIHAIARCADGLGDPRLLADALDLLPHVATALADPPSGQRRAYTDTAAGLSGLLLNLLRLRRHTNALAALDRVIATTTGQLVRDASGEAPKYAVKAGRVVPSGADSVVAALARLVATAPKLGSDARPLVASHRFGTAQLGSRLAHRDAHLSLPELVAAPPKQECADLAAVSTRQLLDLAVGTDAVTSRRVAAQLLARRRTHGSWFADRYAADSVNLGVLDGIGAVALVLLRAADPSVRPIATLR